MLLSLRDRGLAAARKIAVGDGALGFCAALPKVFPTTHEQRCWDHKIANVLNKLRRTLHTEARRHLHQVWMAESRAHAVRALASLRELYRAKSPKPVECVERDKDALFAVYDFPAEHWKHL